MEMTRQILKHELNFDKTINYFIDHIQCGNTLSKKVIERINFELGIFFTFLPFNANVNGLYDFSYGGIIPPTNYGNTLYQINGSIELFQPQEVNTMYHECSEFISLYIKEVKCNCAVVENYMAEPDSSNIITPNVKMDLFQNEIYYLLNDTNSLDEVNDTLRQSTQVWHSLVLLTKQYKGDMIQTNEKLNYFCDTAKFVIASAYDGEGFLFWEKM